MAAVEYDIAEKYQGSTWRWSFCLTEDDDTPIPMAGWTPKMQVREKNADGDVLLELLFVDEPPTEGEESGTGIRVGDQGDPDEVGWMFFYVDKEDSKLVSGGTQAYDVQIVSEGADPEEEYTIAYGAFPVRAEVTRITA